ncbi:Vacuolar import and degradation protein 27, partial [Tilletia horrida]
LSTQTRSQHRCAAAVLTPVKKKATPDLLPEPKTIAVEEPLLTATADLYLYDADTEMFMKQDSGVGAIVKAAGPFTYWLSIASAEKRWVSQRVDVAMNMNFSQDQLSAVWNFSQRVPAECKGQEDIFHVYSWLLRFTNKDAYDDFQTGFAKLMWETLHEEKWSAAKQKENERYLTTAHEEDVEMLSQEERDALEAEEEEAEAAAAAAQAGPATPSKSPAAPKAKTATKAKGKGKKAAPKPNHYARDDEEPLFLGVDDDEVDVDRSLQAARRREEEEEESEEEDEDVGDESAIQEMLGSSRTPGAIAGTERPEVNSELAVGYKSGRSFVVRGNQIGVSKLSDNGKKLEFSTSIRQVGTPKGKVFSPKKVMLHDNDRSLVMMNPDNPNSLFKMDLEVGKVVEEWKVSDDIQIRNAVPTSKFAQMTSEPRLIGHGRNGVFKIDPRLSELKLVDSQYKQCTAKQEFSAATTDEASRLAVALDKGEIRLFDAIGKNAKTALPSIGFHRRPHSRHRSQRRRPLGCHHRGPRRLQLRPRNVALMEQEISFSPARFNTNSDSNETSIVTSSGPFIISWVFADVKRGIYGNYKICRLADRIVQDRFAHDLDNSIIMAFVL